MEIEMALSPPGEYIRTISVQKLFGEFNYDLGPTDAGSNARVLVLYGSNGTGKTTILKLVRDLLSSDFDSGCRTRIASTQFQSVRVGFVSGVSVEAVRKPGEISGGFRWIIRRPDHPVLELNVGSRAKNLSRLEEMDPNFRAAYEQMREFVGNLAPEINYLDDKRTFPSGSSEGRFATHRMPDGSFRKISIGPGSDATDPVDSVLGDIMHAVRREAFLRSNHGASNSQSIYTSLIERLAAGNWRASVESKKGLEALVSMLREVQRRSEVLSAYGLVAPLDHAEMEHALDSADTGSISIVSEVLTPYIESMTARFDALESLYTDIDAWVRNINDFLEPKRVRFKVGEDLQLLSKKSKNLDVETLSSGERHLMFMMGKAFLMRSSKGLMLIDEPEISLNVKWQRDLVRALVAAFGGSGVQLVIATHSLEIASLYLGNVMKLEEGQASEAAGE